MNTAITDQCVPVPALEYRIEEMDGEYLLYSMGETRTIYLNPTAALVLNACDGHRNVGQIVSALSEVYPEAGDAIAVDVPDVIRQFIGYGTLALN